MTLQIELWHVVTLALATLGGFWTLAKIIAGQFQRNIFENHKQISERLDRIESANRLEATEWQRVERDLLKLQADMPLHYVRREDYIRGQSVIEAKLDGLGSKLENAQLRSINSAMNTRRPHDHD